MLQPKNYITQPVISM